MIRTRRVVDGGSKRDAALAAVVTLAWLVIISTEVGGPTSGRVAQTVSNVGLALAALVAGLACWRRAARQQGAGRRFWALLSFYGFSWGGGQVAWTWYESVRGQEVPFPGWSDIGYLAAIPFAVLALLGLPTGSLTLAGRVRTVVDGLIIAGSLLLVSWVLVLDRVYAAGGDGSLAQWISLAYPIGDLVIVTIVVYVLLRARAAHRALSPSLVLVAAGLIAFAVADSGFAYLTASESYASGSIIDAGWFVGYVLIALAARRPSVEAAVDEAAEPASGAALSMLLPYGAVVVALVTTMAEMLKAGRVDAVVSWDRTFVIIMLIVRQLLTLRENFFLTRSLEEKVTSLHASQQWFEALVQQSSDVVTVVDRTGTVLYQSESVHRVLGYAPDAMKDRSLRTLFDAPHDEKFTDALRRAADIPSGVLTVELVARTSSGRARSVEMTITNLLENPNVGGLVLNTRDISERRELEEQLVHQAFHDSLTALANRSLFREKVESVLKGAGDRRGGTVLFLDLDGFKEVNDSLGHASGDLLLAQVADLLRSCVRTGDVVARLGGDEFAVLLEGEQSRPDAAALASRITAALQEPFAVSGRELRVRTSIGIAAADSTVETADQLLRNADLAMYRAKATGGGATEHYDPGMHADLMDRLQLEVDLRRAVPLGQLQLHYQPSVSLTTSQVVGVEALLRWNHPTRGLIMPGDFIGIAESTGLIEPIGRWVLNEACRQGARWHREHPDCPLVISVNVSALQFIAGDLADDVANALSESRLPPGCLMLELTESVLVDHTEDNLAQLHQLKDLGVLLAIDDFGTGYSSLAYLHRFPVDVLKIDRSFVQRLTQPGGDAGLVRSIIQLGNGLGTMTVAEGIEESEQAGMLADLGCAYGQGYLFSRPVPGDQIAGMLGQAALPAHASAVR